MKIIYSDSGGIKSIPISQFPAEAWNSLLGSNVGSNGQLVLNLYESVPWLFRGVNARSDAVANLPVTFMVNGKEVIDYTPPFYLEWETFLNEVEGDLTLFGAAYYWMDIDKPLRARKIERLTPDSIRPIFSSELGLVGFERKISGKTTKFSIDEIGWIWLPNRRKELGNGTSPAYAALKASGTLTAVDSFIGKFFEQGTISPTIIGLDDSVEDADVTRIENWFKRTVSGVKNAFGAVAIRGSIKPALLSQNDLEKLSLKTLTDEKREDIATALGVPQTLLFSNAANYATANQDAFNWYEMTIVPEARRIERRLNEQLFSPLGVSIRFRPEMLELYQEREADKAFKMVQFYDRAIVSKNEVRRQAGWLPIENGDEIPDTNQTPVNVTVNRSIDEIRLYRKKAVNKFKLGKSLDFEFSSDYLIKELLDTLREKLVLCKSIDEINSLFKEVESYASSLASND